MASKKGILTLFLLAHGVLLIMMTVTFPRINAKMGNKAYRQFRKRLRSFGQECNSLTGFCRPKLLRHTFRRYTSFFFPESETYPLQVGGE